MTGVAGIFLGSFLFGFTSIVNDKLYSSTGVSFGDDDFGNTAAGYTVANPSYHDGFEYCLFK